MSKRIYYVTDGESRYLVRAHSPASAIKKAAEGYFKAEVASQETLAELLPKGLKILDAGAEQSALPFAGNEAQ